MKGGGKMRKGWLKLAGLALALALLCTVGCDNHQPGESDFNLIFKYGVNARNELNTFQGTYTKDMIVDPSMTIELSLSEEELDRIYQKMVEIDFFNYPDEFSIPVAPEGPVTIVTPYASYYFKVQHNSVIKELWWEDEIVKEDERADRLRALIEFIRDIVESREEYQKLPQPRSGYL
jgi:hypothetical protein